MKSSAYIICAILVFLVLAAIITGINFNKKKASVRQKLPLLLAAKPMTGRDLCLELKKHGIDMSYGSFYICMRDIKEEGLVKSWDEIEYLEGEELRVRWFGLA